MAPPDKSEHAALADLDKRLAAFEADRRSPAIQAPGSLVAGYRFLAGILGGVFGGLGLGWLADRLAGHWVHTSPFGLLAGLLIGMGFSGYLVIGSASRMAKQAALDAGPLAGVPDEDDAD